MPVSSTATSMPTPVMLVPVPLAIFHRSSALMRGTDWARATVTGESGSMTSTPGWTAIQSRTPAWAVRPMPLSTVVNSRPKTTSGNCSRMAALNLTCCEARSALYSRDSAARTSGSVVPTVSRVARRSTTQGASNLTMTSWVPPADQKPMGVAVTAAPLASTPLAAGPSLPEGPGIRSMTTTPAGMSMNIVNNPMVKTRSNSRRDDRGITTSSTGCQLI